MTGTFRDALRRLLTSVGLSVGSFSEALKAFPE